MSFFRILSYEKRQFADKLQVPKMLLGRFSTNENFANIYLYTLKMSNFSFLCFLFVDFSSKIEL